MLPTCSAFSSSIRPIGRAFWSASFTYVLRSSLFIVFNESQSLPYIRGSDTGPSIMVRVSRNRHLNDNRGPEFPHIRFPDITQESFPLGIPHDGLSTLTIRLKIGIKKRTSFRHIL